MKRFIVAFIACVMIAISLSSCASVSHIEDTNGDGDTSLCKLTDEDLTGKTHVFKQKSVVSQKSGEVSFKVEKMSGVDCVYSFTADKDKTYDFTATTELKCGNLRLFVWCDGNILCDIPIGTDCEFEVRGADGKCEIRAAAESAEFSVKLKT